MIIESSLVCCLVCPVGMECFMRTRWLLLKIMLKMLGPLHGSVLVGGRRALSFRWLTVLSAARLRSVLIPT